MIESNDPKGIPRLSEEDLRQFVLDCLANKIYLSAHIPPQEQASMLPMVFMPLALGGLSEFEDSIGQLGVIYEYMSKASPRSINGYPCFLSMRLLHKEDWDIAYKTILREQVRLDQIELSSGEEEE